MKILVTLTMNENQKNKLEASVPKGTCIMYKSPSEVSKEDVQEVEIILGNVYGNVLKYAENLKWLQLFTAGTEGCFEKGILADNVIVTNATGAFGEAISEHMLGMIFMLRMKLNHYYDNQKLNKWQFFEHMDIISGSTVLILGLGDIGNSFAQKAKALGCYVIGVKRRNSQKPSYVDELYTVKDLKKVISKADIIALSMPGNDTTKNMLNKEMFDLMKENAIVVNVGRGTAIDTQALTEALKKGRIYGAALDVTNPEPLPKENELWSIKNVIITPHISGLSQHPQTKEKILDIMIKNLEAYLKNEDLINVIDRETGYCI